MGINGNGDYTLHSLLLVKCADSIDKLQKLRAIEMKDDDTMSSPTHIMCRDYIDFEFKMSMICLTIRSSLTTLLDIELFKDRLQFNYMERSIQVDQVEARRVANASKVTQTSSTNYHYD
jgi:hypothetical protein